MLPGARRRRFDPSKAFQHNKENRENEKNEPLREGEKTSQYGVVNCSELVKVCADNRVIFSFLQAITCCELLQPDKHRQTFTDNMGIYMFFFKFINGILGKLFHTCKILLKCSTRCREHKALLWWCQGFSFIRICGIVNSCFYIKFPA